MNRVAVRRTGSAVLLSFRVWPVGWAWWFRWSPRWWVVGAQGGRDEDQEFFIVAGAGPVHVEWRPFRVLGKRELNRRRERLVVAEAERFTRDAAL